MRPQNIVKMKKVLPLLLFVLLAFAGCHPTPAVYEESDDPQVVLENCEKFVNYTAEKCKKYNDEDWDKTVEQFVHMCKNYKTNEWQLFEKDRERFLECLHTLIVAVDASGKPEMSAEFKKAYAEVNGNF